VERWEAAQRGGQERGGEIGDVRELEDEVVASLTECPMCRAEVIVRTEGGAWFVFVDHVELRRRQRQRDEGQTECHFFR
jgi:hypothetical protein